MKRILCLMLAFIILLSGCCFLGEQVREPVTFHYLCNHYQEDMCCVIAAEEREATGHTGDLAYLIALYQIGPSDENLSSPLPSGTRISSEMQNGQVTLELSDEASALSDTEYSIACACLTLTCLDIANAESVTVSCGSRCITMTRNSLTLNDTERQTSPTEENQ